ncbi:MAG TPA: DoxX family protein [Thermoanaerobaculia bacterium]|jgi:uncharacterized membrane protein YphA (DoxX/SURF4 family)
MRTTGYWVTTGLLGLVLLSGGAAQLMRRPENVEGMLRLGYPIYLLTILGIWKLLGAAALLAPRMPRLKEWAYAGVFFVLTGAGASHIASGDAAARAFWPLLFAAFTIVSWALRPESRRMSAHV